MFCFVYLLWRENKIGVDMSLVVSVGGWTLPKMERNLLDSRSVSVSEVAGLGRNPISTHGWKWNLLPVVKFLWR